MPVHTNRDLDGVGVPFDRWRGHAAAHGRLDFRIIVFDRIFSPIHRNVQDVIIIVVVVQCLKTGPIAAAGHPHHHRRKPTMRNGRPAVSCCRRHCDYSSCSAAPAAKHQHGKGSAVFGNDTQYEERDTAYAVAAFVDQHYCRQRRLKWWIVVVPKAQHKDRNPDRCVTNGAGPDDSRMESTTAFD
jgi:hypothetical protein